VTPICLTNFSRIVFPERCESRHTCSIFIWFVNFK